MDITITIDDEVYAVLQERIKHIRDQVTDPETNETKIAPKYGTDVGAFISAEILVPGLRPMVESSNSEKIQRLMAAKRQAEQDLADALTPMVSASVESRKK